MTEAPAQFGNYDFTQPCISVHPNLLKAKAFERGGKAQGDPKYSINLILAPDSPDLANLKALAVKLAQDKWPGRNIGAEFKAGTFLLPFAVGTKLADERAAKCAEKGKKPDGEFQRGMIVVGARTLLPPKLAFVANGKIVDLTDETKAAHADKFYFGVKVLARLSLKAYDKVGKTGVDGVTAYLNGVLSLNTGEKLSSGSNLSDTFSGYMGSATQENPLDDEIPF